MPSSPIADAVAQQDRASQLLDLLATVPDPGNRRGVRYRLAAVLAVSVTAVLAGARSFAAIGEWAADLSGEHLARLGLGSAPQESTLRKLYARLGTDALDRVLGAWLWTRTSAGSPTPSIVSCSPTTSARPAEPGAGPGGQCGSWDLRWEVSPAGGR